MRDARPLRKSVPISCYSYHVAVFFSYLSRYDSHAERLSVHTARVFGEIGPRSMGRVSRYKESISRRATRVQVKGGKGSITRGSLSSQSARILRRFRVRKKIENKRTTRTKRALFAACVFRSEGIRVLAGVPVRNSPCVTNQRTKDTRFPIQRAALSTFFPCLHQQTGVHSFSLCARRVDECFIQGETRALATLTREKTGEPKRSAPAEMKGQRSWASLLAINGSIYSTDCNDLRFRLRDCFRFLRSSTRTNVELDVWQQS